MKTVRATAPTRIDLAGGTLDLPPLHLFHAPAITINAGIHIPAEVTITSSNRYVIASEDLGIEASWDHAEDISWDAHPKLELILRIVRAFNPTEPMEVRVRSNAPHGSGLGASSVLAIALTSALAKWQGIELTDAALVERAKSAETQTIKVPTGYQDYWGAMYGGLHAYELGTDGIVQRTPLGSPEFLKKFQEELLLVYTGTPHFSGANNWELFKQHIDGDQKTIAFFDTLKENAITLKDALVREDMDAFATALNADWATRKAMLPTMTTPEIEQLTTQAMTAGAKALRVCGAGAGGCALLLVNPEQRQAVLDVVQNLGMRDLQAVLSPTGQTATFV
jgi:D-glycero-alpha-D-manno-heptose-7-phosphate kinase